MSHLTTESLARLVDEPATEAESTHLEACTSCRDVLDQLRAQTAALATLPRYAPRSDAWDAIRVEMRAEHHRQHARRGDILRIAAAIGIFALGAAAQAALYAGHDARTTAEGPGAASSSEGGVTTDLISAGAPKTIDEAAARLRVAETMYTRALLDYAALASPEPPRDAVARLATLEAIVLTTRAALERAPADPLINTYYLAAQAERESLLDQLRRRSEAGRWY